MKISEKDKKRLAAGTHFKCSGCKKIHNEYLWRFPNQLTEHLICKRCGAFTVRPIIIKRFEYAIENKLGSIKQKFIHKDEFGDKWPFEVDSGWLKCYGHDREVTFIDDRIEYALNGIANNNPKFSKIKFIHSEDKLATDPNIKKDLGPIIEYAIYDLYGVDKKEMIELFTRVV